MDNLEIYNKLREVPKDAQRAITAGRLKGKTDINPMWRIKALTETFGPCGVGWYYEIKDQWTVPAGNEIAAFCNINLYVRVGTKDDPKWSMPIPGTGGSMLLEQESKGLHSNDECYKMALTDAISVACKALGVGADVYWEKDANKYQTGEPTAPAPRNRQHNGDATQQKPRNTDGARRCSACGADISDRVYDYSIGKYSRPLCMECQKTA